MTLVDGNIQAENAAWSFENISEDFDEHVRRSVPLYDESHDITCKLSDFFLPQGATVVELGTATGVLAEKFLKYNSNRSDINYIGVDCVESMLVKARERCIGDERVLFKHDDITTGSIDNSTMILSHYTMQFVHPKDRQALFDKVYQSLEWGGAFVLFEKVRAPDARFQDIMSQLYIEFKKDKGFTDLEIMAKQRSLKGIQEPFSTSGNLGLLERSGFVDVMTIMKSICFEGFLAIK